MKLGRLKAPALTLHLLLKSAGAHREKAGVGACREARPVLLFLNCLILTLAAVTDLIGLAGE